jgi:hypothetical protein
MHASEMSLHWVAAMIFGTHDRSMHVAICGRQFVSTLQPSSLTPRHERTMSHGVVSRACAKTSHETSAGADSVHGRPVQFDLRTKHFPWL